MKRGALDFKNNMICIMTAELMFTRSSSAGVKVRNKRNRNKFIKVNGFVKK